MKARSRFVVLCFLILAAVISMSQVAAQENGPRVRMAHFAPKAPAVDVYVGDMKFVENLAYKSASQYWAVDPGMLMITVVPAGGGVGSSVTPEPLSVMVPDMKDGYFTMAAVGDPADSTFELVILQDGPAVMVPVAIGAATVGDLVISGAWARPTRMAESSAMGEVATPETGGGMHMAMGDVSAAYMLIENKGTAADRLVAVESDVTDDAQIHQTVIENDVAKMQELEMGLELPAGGQVELMPGGYHIMLVSVKRPLAPGDSIHLTLRFESGATAELVLPVKMMMMP